VTTIDESLVRWCPANEALELHRVGRATFLDAREPPEFREASLPGARLLGQSALMFNAEKQRALIEELRRADGELILFGNTGTCHTQRSQIRR
jgi:rhodanese-related sulfurtransferase